MSNLEEVLVCPKMRCDSCQLFDTEKYQLPCGRHGLRMVSQSEMPIRKTIYRFIISRIFKLKYITHRVIR